MKVLIVVDIIGWAIGALSMAIKKHNPQFQVEIIAIHPKDLRNNPDVWVPIFAQKVKDFKPDVVHFQYWDFIPRLREHCGSAKTILTHHNQKNLLTHQWDVDAIVCHTKKAHEMLTGAGYENVHIIQHGIDLEHFRYTEDLSEGGLIGYVGRIVPWKGLYNVLKAAKALGTKVIMMGRIDRPEYWEKCLEFKEQMIECFGTPYGEQPNVYHKMTVFVGNSDDGIEEGTLPLLEAMACGIPVVTTPSGEAKDIISDGDNGRIAEFGNYESLLSAIRRTLEDKEWREKARSAAWHTVRHMTERHMARRYERLYYSLAYQRDLVSAIIPTYNRAGTITTVLDAYLKQSYRPIELVVVDDNSTDETAKVLHEWRLKNPAIPFKYLNTKQEGYGLAKARNMGIFAASGHYLLFNDDRFVPEPNAVAVFVEAIKGKKEKIAFWGDKGSGKRDFIENFFVIRRQHIADAGMFNERIDEYGGQSQEIRQRLKRQGFSLVYCPEAKSLPVFGTHNRAKKRYELLKMKTKLWLLEH